MEQHHHSQHQNRLQNHNLNNEINVSVSYKDNLITIYIENIDDIKTPIKLVKNHEKFMHLIIVSEDLNDFFHLHPEKVDANHFEQEINLSNEKKYKAFVDIIVEGKDYVIKPIAVNSSNKNEQKSPLKLDTLNKKEIQGYYIEMEHGHFMVNKTIELKFKIKNAIPDPYLGALGHVVIIDEQAEKFIHVHPISNNETIFETQFEKAGIYKLWAEFKFGQDIIAFPYVFSVTETLH